MGRGGSEGTRQGQCLAGMTLRNEKQYRPTQLVRWERGV